MSHMTVSFVFHTGSMVPFSLRILRAELPQYMGRPRDALDSLYELQKTCAQVLKNLRGNRMEDGGQGDITPANRMGEYKQNYNHFLVEICPGFHPIVRRMLVYISALTMG